MRRFFVAVLAVIIVAALLPFGCSDMADEHYRAAMAFHRDGRLQAAVEELRAALACRPAFSRALVCLGKLYVELGQNERAYDTLSQGALSATADGRPLAARPGAKGAWVIPLEVSHPGMEWRVAFRPREAPVNLPDPEAVAVPADIRIEARSAR